MDELNNIFEKIKNDMHFEPCKPFEVTVDLREVKKTRTSQSIVVPVDYYEELIRADQDARYLKEWVFKTAKSNTANYKLKEEIELLNMVFNESEE